MQNRYFSDFSHIGVDFRILICEFAYAWRPCSMILAGTLTLIVTSKGVARVYFLLRH